MRGGAQIRSKIWILPATHAHSLHTDKNAMEHFGPKIGPPLNLSRVSYSGAVFSVLSPHQDLTSSFCLSFELWPTRMGFWGGTTASFVNIIFKNTVSTRVSYLGAVFSVLYHRDLTSSLGRLWMNKMGFCGVFYGSISCLRLLPQASLQPKGAWMLPGQAENCNIGFAKETSHKKLSSANICAGPRSGRI